MESNKLDINLLRNYIRAFVFREIALNGVDPREGLDGTSLRLNTTAPYAEGYKYEIYRKYHSLLQEHQQPYLQIIRHALDDAANNLVYKQYQRDRLLPKEDERAARLEQALEKLYQTNADAEAFEDIVEVNGERFDIIGFLFFLKDRERYLPISPKNFDARFAKIGLATHFDHGCSWSNYEYFNHLLNDIRMHLQTMLHPDITLLDTHSFIWMLFDLDLYLDDSYRIAEHAKFGKGIVKAFNNHNVVIQFQDKERVFDLHTVIRNNMLHFLSGQSVSQEDQKLNETADERLIDELKHNSLSDCRSGFVYRGKPRERAESVTEKSNTAYPRDRQTAMNALSHADFRCEIDPSHPTFIRRNSDIRYTEPHHLVPLSVYRMFPVSLDVEENIVSLCSNCHNEIHYGRDAARLIRKLFAMRKDDLHNAGIDITEDKLIALYNDAHADKEN